MGERIDLTIRVYLRIVAFLYIFQIIPLSIGYFFYPPVTGEGLGEIIFALYVEMPFFEDRALGDLTFLPYIFWSFWIITFLRWITTGKHFYQ